MTLRRIRLRRGTASAWTTANPVLGVGEPGFETDTRKVKIGDGATVWASLPYVIDPGSASIPADVLRTTTTNVVLYASTNALVGSAYVAPGYYRKTSGGWAYDETLQNLAIARSRNSLPHTLTLDDVKGGLFLLGPSANGTLTLPANLLSPPALTGAEAWLPFTIIVTTSVTVTLSAGSGVSLFVPGQVASQASLSMAGPNARAALMTRGSIYRQL